eukprot:CAMPEP_0178410932 /NCGR_PEP_ID=MMETSP0689_2-20121128/21237_1 /TAXON_ID=160604 /ORGANISM="Amphidinium massartii, Strain CS-259" /LENGTH=966 /DNA_ID=CAMNT_0020032129 /DNA_START=183 /DNA_END=3080 /DNA_ORIENTATION=+
MTMIPTRMMQVAVLCLCFAVHTMGSISCDVFLFLDPSIVDMGREGINTQNQVRTLFPGYTSVTTAAALVSRLEAGLPEGSVLIIPEQERGSLIQAMRGTSSNAVAALTHNVQQRGVHLMVMGSNRFYVNRDVEVINAVSTWNVAHVGSGIECENERGRSVPRTIAGGGFGGGPSAVPFVSAVYCMDTASLPSNADGLYASNGESYAWTAALLRGRVTHIGADFFEVHSSWSSLMGASAAEVCNGFSTTTTRRISTSTSESTTTSSSTSESTTTSSSTSSSASSESSTSTRTSTSKPTNPSSSSTSTSTGPSTSTSTSTASSTSTSSTTSSASNTSGSSSSSTTASPSSSTSETSSTTTTTLTSTSSASSSTTTSLSTSSSTSPESSRTLSTSSSTTTSTSTTSSPIVVECYPNYMLCRPPQQGTWVVATAPEACGLFSATAENRVLNISYTECAPETAWGNDTVTYTYEVLRVHGHWQYEDTSAARFHCSCESPREAAVNGSVGVTTPAPQGTTRSHDFVIDFEMHSDSSYSNVIQAAPEGQEQFFFRLASQSERDELELTELKVCDALHEDGILCQPLVMDSCILNPWLQITVTRAGHEVFVEMLSFRLLGTEKLHLFAKARRCESGDDQCGVCQSASSTPSAGVGSGEARLLSFLAPRGAPRLLSEDVSEQGEQGMEFSTSGTEMAAIVPGLGDTLETSGNDRHEVTVELASPGAPSDTPVSEITDAVIAAVGPGVTVIDMSFIHHSPARETALLATSSSIMVVGFRSHDGSGAFGGNATAAAELLESVLLQLGVPVIGGSVGLDLGAAVSTSLASGTHQPPRVTTPESAGRGSSNWITSQHSSTPISTSVMTSDSSKSGISDEADDGSGADSVEIDKSQALLILAVLLTGTIACICFVCCCCMVGFGGSWLTRHLSRGGAAVEMAAEAKASSGAHAPYPYQVYGLRQQALVKSPRQDWVKDLP